MRKIRAAGLVVLLLVFLYAGLSHISFDVDVLRLLPTNLRAVRGLSLFLQHFSLPNELIVTVTAERAKEAESATESIAGALRSRNTIVRQVVSEPPWEKNPVQLSEFVAWLVLNETPAESDALLARIAPGQAARTAQETLEKLSETISPQELALLGYDPFGLTLPLTTGDFFSQTAQSEFSSADGKFRVLYVEGARRFRTYRDNISWIREIRATISQTHLPTGVKVGLTGEPAFVADISGSMQFDMCSSGFVTMLLIGIIFWLCYHRHGPLRDLMTMLIVIFLVSLAFAGLFLPQLTVIGVGFASIMIGLSVDYGYFVYQRSLSHHGSVRVLQKDCLQNILWTSGTTAAAFFALNLSSLPGLSQLGNLVGIGVLVGATVMLGVFAQIAARYPKTDDRGNWGKRFFTSPGFVRAGIWFTLALLGIATVGLIWKGPPRADFSARTLRPRKSGAYDAMDQLTARLTNDADFVSLIVTGPDDETVRQRLEWADARLHAAKAQGLVTSYRSALPLWPSVKNQTCNLPRLRGLVNELPRLQQVVLANGFTEESLGLTRNVFQQFAQWGERKPPIWPENPASHWILRRVASHRDAQVAALGLLHPVPGKHQALANLLQGEGVYLASWGLLGDELLREIPKEFLQTIVGLVSLVLLILAIAFRSLRDVGLFVGITALVLATLAGVMSLLGMTWNFFNLAAILLLLGTGTDYSILLLLELRRNGGDAVAARATLGQVIVLCAASASAGFGSITWANNRGLASLGQTCALGLVIDALISIFLLPEARRWLMNRSHA
ncbi:MAG TPA: MMPL family transporter [Chthoniobacterales bacterium]|jgi:predicted RND superfamily exporter protein